MNAELRKAFSELKAKCKTQGQRKAFNEMIKSFSLTDDNNVIAKCINDKDKKFNVDIYGGDDKEMLRKYKTKGWNLSFLKADTPFGHDSEKVKKIKEDLKSKGYREVPSEEAYENDPYS